MKWLSYSADGRNSYGFVTGDGVVDVRKHLGAEYPTLRTAMIGNVLARALSELKGAKPDVSLSAIKYLPPITDAEKIICIGRNYAAHTAEAGLPPPKFPSLFIRVASSLAPHNTPMIVPKLSGDFDYECELAFVISKPGRHIARSEAMNHVFGYTCFNDGSIRDVQFNHSVAAGKNFPATGGIGPWIVTSDELGDPLNLEIMTRINGRELQHDNTGHMVFDIAAIISYVSGWTRLEIGDVLTAGTPEGCGFARKPPLWVKAGDVVEVEISRIGVLRNPVIAET